MEPLKYPFMFIAAGILTILAFSHLLYGIHTTKQADNLTYYWILLVGLAQSLLLIYGILNNSYVTYLPAFLFLLGLSYILYIKMNYETNAKIEDELKNKDIL